MNVLISGGSRGIGAACVRRFAGEGHAVSFLYHTSAQQAQALSRETGAQALQADVAAPGQVLAAVGGRRFDVLVACAGIASYGLFQELGDEAWARLLAVNLGGVRSCVNAVLPGMLHAQSGAIIAIGSVWGQTGGSCEAAYSASKGAVSALCKALAKELGPSGIRVNCVSPGVIATDMTLHLGAETLQTLAEETPLGRIGTAEEVADAVYFLASDQARFITGQELGVNGGFFI